MTSLSSTQILAALLLVWLFKTVIQRFTAIVKTARDIRSCPGAGVLLYNPFGGLSLAVDRWSPIKWRFHDYHAIFDRECNVILWNRRNYFHASLQTIWKHDPQLIHYLGW